MSVASRFHALRVADIRKTTRDAVVVTLRPVDGGDFRFKPGQYLTFRRVLEGVELRRSYSICASPSEGVLKVGIKRVAGGAFSTWANTALAVGDTLEAMAPNGTFHVAVEPSRARHHLGFAGGSGITPMLSILKTVLEEEPLSTFTLVYTNQSIATIMFRDALEDLKNRFMGRLSVIHILEHDNQDMELFSGRIDAERCAGLFSGWIDLALVETAFICGPEPMMQTIATALRAHGLPEEQIKFELFAGGQPGRVARKTDAEAAGPAEAPVRLTVQLDGARQTVEMTRDATLLEAALESGMDVPFACKAGVCSTCMCRVLEGQVEMQANHALEDHEVKAGFVLSCQSFPRSERVVIDYDRGH